MKELINKLFQQFGFHIESQWMYEQRQLLQKILTELFLKKHSAPFSEKISTIICFSKDRPMQLDALLFSMKQMIDDFDKIPIKVIYYSSNDDFQKGYDKLRGLAYCSKVNFIKETSFRDNLMALLSKIKSEKVLFLVDDLFFKNPLDWKSFSALDNDTYIPSLRHGTHLDFAYTVQKAQVMPKVQDVNGMISWQWSDGVLDWNYPLSLDGHLFKTEEIYTLFKWIEFNAPNSLEHSMQIAKKVFAKRKGIAYKESIVVNNPANKVQNENPNYHGKADNAALNNAWLDDYRFNFEAYQGIRNRSVHELLEIKLIEDERQ